MTWPEVKDQDLLLTPEVCYSVGFLVVVQLTSVQGSSPMGKPCPLGNPSTRTCVAQQGYPLKSHTYGELLSLPVKMQIMPEAVLSSKTTKSSYILH